MLWSSVGQIKYKALTRPITSKRAKLCHKSYNCFLRSRGSAAPYERVENCSNKNAAHAVRDDLEFAKALRLLAVVFHRLYCKLQRYLSDTVWTFRFYICICSCCRLSYCHFIIMAWYCCSILVQRCGCDTRRSHWQPLLFLLCPYIRVFIVVIVVERKLHTLTWSVWLQKFDSCLAWSAASALLLARSLACGAVKVAQIFQKNGQ